MNQWYYAKDGTQQGPVSLDELRSLLQAGKVTAGDLVWNPSMKDWLPASAVAEISGGAGVPANAGNPYATPDSAWSVMPATNPTEGLAEIAPGSDSLGVTASIGRGFDLTKKNFVPLLLAVLIIFGISMAVSMPFSLAQAFMGASAPQAIPPEVAADPIAGFQWGMRSQFTVLYFINQVVSLVVSSYLFAGFYRICLNVFSGAPTSPGQLFGESDKLGRMLVISFLLSIPSWAGYFALVLLPMEVGGPILLACMVLTVIFWLRLGFAGMALVDKNLKVGEALKYSVSITRGSTLRLFGLGFLASLIMMAGVIACFVGMLFTFPVAMMAVTVAFRWLQFGRGVALAQPALRGPTAG